MGTKVVYMYDLAGYYSGPVTLDDSDKSPSGQWLVPGRATEIVPPESREHYLIHWSGEGWEYVEDKHNPVPPPPHVPTKEEKLAALDGEYAGEKATLCQEYTDAQIHGDSDTADAIVAEMNELDSWYDEEYQRIINEEEE